MIYVRSVNVRMATDVMLLMDFANAFLVGLDCTVQKVRLYRFSTEQNSDNCETKQSFSTGP